MQNAFSRPFYLVHYDLNQFLHVDIEVSKQWGFGTIIYHIRANKKTFSKKDVEFILFFNRCLTKIEIKYWPTELETTGLVWVVKKIKHMFNAARPRFQVIIYTDHSVTIFIVKQIKLTTSNFNKFNFRFVRVSICFSQFAFDVKHKPKKFHVIPDVLFRLSKKSSITPPISESIFDNVYHTAFIVEDEPIFFFTLF